MIDAFSFHLMFALAFVVCCYLATLVACVADLWSGVRKAKQRGEHIRSHKLRETIEKATKYYNILMILTLTDALQMAFVIFADHLYGYNIVLFPFVTLIGTIGVVAIELKSIFEKADAKSRKDYKQLADAVVNLARDHSAEQVASEIVKYICSTKEKETDGFEQHS